MSLSCCSTSRRALQLTSVLLLPICLGFLYSSITTATWFQLELRRDAPQAQHANPQILAESKLLSSSRTPISLSTGGIESAILSKSRSNGSEATDQRSFLQVSAPPSTVSDSEDALTDKHGYGKGELISSRTFTSTTRRGKSLEDKRRRSTDLEDKRRRSTDLEDKRRRSTEEDRKEVISKDEGATGAENSEGHPIARMLDAETAKTRGIEGGSSRIVDKERHDIHSGGIHSAVAEPADFADSDRVLQFLTQIYGGGSGHLPQILLTPDIQQAFAELVLRQIEEKESNNVSDSILTETTSNLDASSAELLQAPFNEPLSLTNASSSSTTKALSFALSILASASANPDSTLIISMRWSLHSINLTMPYLHVKRLIQMEDLRVDPFLALALSFGGFYEALLDANSATKLIYTLGWISFFPLSVAFVIIAGLLIWDLIPRRAERSSWRSMTPQTMAPLLAGEPHGEGAESPHSQYPAQQTRHPSTPTTVREHVLSLSQTSGPYSHPLEGVRLRVERPNCASSKILFDLAGILSLISAVCCAIGLGVWATRTLNDANRILAGIAHLLGDEAVVWIQKHKSLHIDVGLVEFASSIGLMLTVALANICANFQKKVYLVKSEVNERPISHAVYQPPGPENQ